MKRNVRQISREDLLRNNRH